LSVSQTNFLFYTVWSLILCFIGLTASSSAGGQKNLAPYTVYVIPVHGEVGPELAAFIERSLREKAGFGQNLYVLELDTFGGRVDAALQVVEHLLNVTDGKTIAFVKSKAISAGALIALACEELVMRPHATLGDCAPITYSSEGPQVMGEKFQSPLRAKFRTMAKRNGYPEVLAESMVTAEMEVLEVIIDGRKSYLDSQALADLPAETKKKIGSQKIMVAKGELLTMDDDEARQLGFSRFSSASIEEMLATMGIEDYRLIRMEQNWAEKLTGIVSKITPLLMIIGLAALYTEIKAPGFGIPGIVGVLCLGLIFLNQYLVGLADYTEFLVVIIGVVLLAFEVFVIPGFGLAGIAGLFCIGIGLVLSMQNFVVPDPSLPWQKELLSSNIIEVLGAIVVSFISAILAMRYVLPRFGALVDGPYLQTTLTSSRASVRNASGLSLGDQGVAETSLRPAGKALFGDILVDVVTDGEYIEKGASLTISAIKGNRVIVAGRDEE
jgi:membrane-bound serine protease (ClpP class)